MDAIQSRHAPAGWMSAIFSVHSLKMRLLRRFFALPRPLLRPFAYRWTQLPCRSQQPSSRHPQVRRGEQHEHLDRKSVGSGKSVSVREDLGGRRTIKKNKESTKKAKDK